MEKKCIECGKLFKKPYTCSKDRWQKRQFCSLYCGRSSIKTREKISQSNKGKNKMGKVHKSKLIALSKQRTGNNHPGWKGKSASYAALHKWVNKYNGRPLECEHCGTTNNEVGRSNLHWANIDHLYNRNLDDYLPLCPSCHGKYDKEIRVLINN